MAAQAYDSMNAALRSMVQGVTDVIVHRGDATGDLPHVVGAVTLSPAIGVLVVDGQAKNKHITGGKGRIADVLVDNFGLPTDRVAYHNRGMNSLPGTGNRKVSGRTFKLRSLGYSTRVVRESLAAAPDDGTATALLQQVKVRLRGDDFAPNDELSETDAMCADFWAGHGISYAKHTVILWGRKPGEGGMHRELSHSYLGMLQLCQQLCPERQVIIAGDYDIPEQDDPLFANHMSILATGAIVIGPYWEQDRALWTRNNQIRLFHILRVGLNAQGSRMVHVGMRSGGLDMFALSGQRTIYLVGPDTKDVRVGPRDDPSHIPLTTAVSRTNDAHMEQFRTAQLPDAGGTPEGQGFEKQRLAELVGRIKAVAG